MDTDSLLLLWREYSIRGGMVAAKNIFFSPLRCHYWKIPSLVGLKLGPRIGQFFGSDHRHTHNRFQSIGPYFNICSLPDLGEPLNQLRVAAARGAEVPQLLQHRANQLLALPHLRPRHIF